MLTFTIAIGFLLGIYCWHGNEVTLESCKIADAIYECNWIYCDKNAKICLMLMIQRAQKPCYLTAAKFTNVVLDTYVAVRKTLTY